MKRCGLKLRRQNEVDKIARNVDKAHEMLPPFDVGSNCWHLS